MSRIAQLYASTNGWNSKHAVVMESLGIPTDDNSTQVYAYMEMRPTVYFKQIGGLGQ